MTQYIEALGIMSGTREDGAPMRQDDAVNIGSLLARDATYGTYGEFSGEYWGDKLSSGIAELAIVDNVESISDKGEFSFRLRIDSTLFDPNLGGIQHLIGVLAGDLVSL